MITIDEKNARRFAGNENVLCDIGYNGCPFVKISGSDSAFCLLYKKPLNYYETGNNDICNRHIDCVKIRRK